MQQGTMAILRPGFHACSILTRFVKRAFRKSETSQCKLVATSLGRKKLLLNAVMTNLRCRRRALMPADSRIPRVLLCSALFLSALGFAAGDSPPAGAERSTPKRPGGKCPLLRSLQVCGSGNLQDLSRGDLQRLGEDAALEDHAKQKGGPSNQGCEGCHGPGAEHVAGGGDIPRYSIPRSTRPKRWTPSA